MMCQKCFDAVKRHWPDLPESQYDDLLMGATCFPCGGPEAVEAQVAELAQQSNCNLGYALAIADTEMREATKAIPTDGH